MAISFIGKVIPKESVNRDYEKAIIVFEDNKLQVRYKAKLYPISDLTIEDKTILYSSPQNNAYPSWTKKDRIPKSVTHLKAAMKYWFPYKPGLSVTGSVKNGEYVITSCKHE